MMVRVKTRLMKLKTGLTLVICLCTAVVLWMVNRSGYDDSRPRLWLRDVKADVRRLLDDNVTTGRDFLTSNNNLHLLDSYVRSFNSVYDRTGISCPDLFRGSPEEIQKSREYMKRNEPPVRNADFYKELTKDCRQFVEKQGYLTIPESKEEASFPIAFNILIHKDFQMAERLLRAVYAPQNYYCIHVDHKSPDVVKDVLRRIAECLPNVIVPRKLISVSWGHMSLMYAEMMCMEELLKHKWKYFINISGQMFPLMSNTEIVRVLKLFQGANDVEGSHSKAKNLIFRFRQLVEWEHSELLDINVFTLRFKSPPPHDVTLYTGSNQVILSRAFVVYFLYSKASHDIIDWFSNTLVPDEYIWSTINHNAHIKAPGGYTGNPEEKPTIARLSLWYSFYSHVPWKCQGTWKRELCIFGVGDLQWLIRQPHLFVNKFHSDFEWLALDCMEELVFNRTVVSLYNKITRSAPQEATLGLKLNMTFYESLPFIANPSLVTSIGNPEFWNVEG